MSKIPGCEHFRQTFQRKPTLSREKIPNKRVTGPLVRDLFWVGPPFVAASLPQEGMWPAWQLLNNGWPTSWDDDSEILCLACMKPFCLWLTWRQLDIPWNQNWLVGRDCFCLADFETSGKALVSGNVATIYLVFVGVFGLKTTPTPKKVSKLPHPKTKKCTLEIDSFLESLIWVEALPKLLEVWHPFTSLKKPCNCTALAASS